MTRFGETLRRIRTEKQMNQDALAAKTGLTQAAISQFEKGLRVPTPAKIKEFAEILGVSQDEFFPDPEHERKTLMREIKQMNPEELQDLDKFIGFLKSKRQGDKGANSDVD
jgi:transcriptional regulator with XRE-family HTH domain